MQIEWKYVVETFNTNIEKGKDKRIVLYGIGKHTKAILDELGDQYNFVGLMDAEKAGEKLWGYPILHVNELKENGVDLIVIIARPSVHQIIYRRIAEYVENNNIPAFSITGEQIHAEEDFKELNNQYYIFQKQNLLDEIDKYDVISFDVFDTLIMRKILYPKDLFLLLDYEFKDKNLGFVFSDIRQETELELMRLRYPKLSEIYDSIRVKYDLSKEICQELMQMEIQKEHQLIIPRDDIIEAFHYAINHNKKVYIVSDMYLPITEMEALLEENGISGFEKLFISCEYRKTKQEGLFSELLLFEDSKRILHIGDDEKADVLAAESLGISAFKIMKAYEMVNHSSYYKIMDGSDKIYNRYYLGLMISRLFNSPFALYGTKGKYQINTLDKLSNLIAPTILNYLLWIIQRVQEQKASDILFVSRDGYLPMKIYQMICQKQKLNDLPKGKYIYTSGRAASIPAMTDITDLLPMLEEFKGDVQELFTNIFCLDGYEVNPDASIAENVKVNVDEIIKEAQQERIDYQSYLDDQNICFDNEVMLFDFFSKGTGQDNLERILDKKLNGVYLHKSISGISRRNEIDYFSLYKANNHYEKNYNVFKLYSLLEYIISSPEPCLKKISKESKLFFPEDRTIEGKQFMIKIQKGIFEFCVDFIDSFSGGIPERFDGEFTDSILGLIEKSTIESSVLPDLSTYEWFNGAFKVVGKI
jgi:HAD superfamily hydrolase (TIGR01549 family)